MRKSNHKAKQFFKEYTSNAPYFQITIDTRIGTNELDSTFILPTAGRYFDYPAGNGDAIVRWGDGTEEQLINIPGNVLHTYPEPGVYQISISGSFRNIYFPNSPVSAPKLLSIDNWGTTVKWGNATIAPTGNSFKGCYNMVGKYKDKMWLSNFEGCTLFNREPIGTAISLLNTFKGCKYFKQTLARVNINQVPQMTEVCKDLDINEFGTTANYDNTLIAWSSKSKQVMKKNVTANFGISMFSENAQPAKDFLVGTMNWKFIDGGRIDGVEESFNFMVNTSISGATNSISFRIPTIGSGYNCTVFWGDGLSNTYTGSPGNINHMYSTAGTYKIRIEGTFPRIYFNNTGDCKKVVSLDK